MGTEQNSHLEADSGSGNDEGGKGNGAHDFFACAECRAAGRYVEEAVAKIRRWSEAIIQLSPPPEIKKDEEEPDQLRNGVNVFAVTEGLAHAIFYEADSLGSNLPSRSLCEDEWERMRDDPTRKQSGPKAVAR